MKIQIILGGSKSLLTSVTKSASHKPKLRIAFALLLSIFTWGVSYGQVATISDSDGWTNVRMAADEESIIIHKVYENEVFWYDAEVYDLKQDWIRVYIPKNDYCLGQSDPSDIVGFIHTSRLLPLKKLESYSGKDFSFRYKISDFDQTNRVIDLQNNKWVEALDGRKVWGQDGDFPKSQVDDIEITIGGRNIVIHKVFYSDIFECDNDLSFYKNGETYFAHQSNSDGAGSYEIVWVLDKNGLKQRLVGTIH